MILYGSDKDWMIDKKTDKIVLGMIMLASQISILTSDFEIHNV